MTLLRRRSSTPVTVEALQARAEKSAAIAKRDADAVQFAIESSLCQQAVVKKADEIAARCADADKWNSHRDDVSSRLGVQQRSCWDLAGRINVATTAMNTALQSGDVEAGSQHAANITAMQTALTATQTFVASLQRELSGIPVGDVTQDERNSVPLLRQVALSPEKSFALIVPTLPKQDKAADLRALGRRVMREQREHPQLRRTGMQPMWNKDMQQATHSTRTA